MILSAPYQGSDDSVLGQLVQLQVIEGLPGADDGDVCGDKDAFRPLTHAAADVRCVFANSPVPKPSIPGMSSPKLQTKHSYTPELELIPSVCVCVWHTPGLPSSGACS